MKELYYTPQEIADNELLLTKHGRPTNNYQMVVRYIREGELEAFRSKPYLVSQRVIAKWNRKYKK